MYYTLINYIEQFISIFKMDIKKTKNKQKDVINDIMDEHDTFSEYSMDSSFTEEESQVNPDLEFNQTIDEFVMSLDEKSKKNKLKKEDKDKMNYIFGEQKK